MSEPPKEQQISIRFPLEVLAAVKELAQQHERSFNGEVIWALREYVARQRKSAKTEPEA
jgi:hypothetical protein